MTAVRNEPRYTFVVRRARDRWTWEACRRDDAEITTIAEGTARFHWIAKRRAKHAIRVDIEGRRASGRRS